MRIIPAIVLLATLTAVQSPRSGAVPELQAVGAVRFTTSCSPAAGPTFNRGVALLHSFAFSQAVEQFNAVLAADPHCAIAWWGIAVSAWGNPFAPGIKPAAQIQRGLEAVTRARSAGTPTARESRYIDAAARLYERADSVGQPARLLAYRNAMAELTAGEPADTEAAIFHALAMVIAADPTDKTYSSQLAAGATLERLFAKLPDHPGLAHYIIHAYDVPPLANRALDAAQRYSQIAPTVSHALHMPSHTYTRVGDWEHSIQANVRSAESAHREGSTAEELHASDYRVYAYLQLGQDSAVRQVLAALPGIAPHLDPTALGTGAPPAAGFYAIAAIPARYALERGEWAEAARLEVHQSPTPFANAVTWYARGIGGARSGDTATTAAAISELQRIQERLLRAGEAYWGGQIDIQLRSVIAWRDFSAGRNAEALAEMRTAVELEDATDKSAITPGPIAPARELFGEMLLAAGQPVPALAAFEAALKQEPNRFRSIAGAAKAANAAGQPEVARRHYAELLRLGTHADRPGRADLVEARRVLKKGPN